MGKRDFGYCSLVFPILLQCVTGVVVVVGWWFIFRFHLLFPFALSALHFSFCRWKLSRVLVVDSRVFQFVSFFLIVFRLSAKCFWFGNFWRLFARWSFSIVSFFISHWTLSLVSLGVYVWCVCVCVQHACVNDKKTFANDTHEPNLDFIFKFFRTFVMLPVCCLLFAQFFLLYNGCNDRFVWGFSVYEWIIQWKFQFCFLLFCFSPVFVSEVEWKCKSTIKYLMKRNQVKSLAFFGMKT